MITFNTSKNSVLSFLFTSILSLYSVYAEEKKIDIGHKPKLVELKEIAASFSQLNDILHSIKPDTTFTLYQGVSRQLKKPANTELAPKNTETINRYGYTFYLAPIKIEDKDKLALTTLIHNQKSFTKFSGYKKCGGFHPDFSLIWGEQADKIELQLCFGCHEIKVYKNDMEVYCDISNKSYDQFKEILSKYNKKHLKTK